MPPELVIHPRAGLYMLPSEQGKTYTQRISEGEISGAAPLHKFGYNNNIGTSWESAWSPGGVVPYLYVAEQLKASSASANDTLGGTGTNTFSFFGLDTNYNEISETKDMAGTALITTEQYFLRHFRSRSVTAGTIGVNDGIISVYDNTGGTVLSQIPAGSGSTEMAIWTVPTNKILYITQMLITTTGTKDLIARMMTRDGSIVAASWQEQFVWTAVDFSVPINYDPPLPITEKTDIDIQFKSVQGSQSAEFRFSGYYR